MLQTAGKHRLVRSLRSALWAGLSRVAVLLPLPQSVLLAVPFGLDWDRVKLASLTYLVIGWLDPSFFEVFHSQEATLGVSSYDGPAFLGDQTRNCKAT